MLCELSAEGLGVIDDAELILEPGMTVLTGETGAGKTLMVVALSLLCGDRADRALVRQGASGAHVEGRFVVPAAHESLALLRSHGLLDEDPDDQVEVIVARTIGADGRSKARINGRMTPISTLSEVGRTLVDITGKNESHRLALPAVQRAMLDAFAGPDAVDLAAQVAGAVRDAAAARARLEELNAHARERSRELDVLAFEINEIERAGVQAGESAELSELVRRLANAETVATAVTNASHALKGEGGATDLIAGAGSEIESAAAVDDELASLPARLEAAAIEIADVADELAGRVVAPDPEALENAQQRLAGLARLKRKYGDDEGEILAYLDRAKARRAEIEGHDADVEANERDFELRTATATRAAGRLGELRRAAAERLENEVGELLVGLALKGARFHVVIDPRPLYDGGLDHIHFAVAVNAGDEPLPLTKVASGGELSRIALALHLVTASTAAPTTVFDEVDAGLGGEAAQSVGRALAGLAERARSQVLVVTHLPQVAAFAGHHVRVVKDERSGRVAATVETVAGEERIVEPSRLLA